MKAPASQDQWPRAWLAKSEMDFHEVLPHPDVLDDFVAYVPESAIEAAKAQGRQEAFEEGLLQGKIDTLRGIENECRAADSPAAIYWQEQRQAAEEAKAQRATGSGAENG